MPAPKYYRVVDKDGKPHWYRSRKKATDSHPDRLIEQFASKSDMKTVKVVTPEGKKVPRGTVAVLGVEGHTRSASRPLRRDEVPLTITPTKRESNYYDEVMRVRAQVKRGKWEDMSFFRRKYVMNKAGIGPDEALLHASDEFGELPPSVRRELIERDWKLPEDTTFTEREFGSSKRLLEALAYKDEFFKRDDDKRMQRKSLEEAGITLHTSKGGMLDPFPGAMGRLADNPDAHAYLVEGAVVHDKPVIISSFHPIKMKGLRPLNKDEVLNYART